MSGKYNGMQARIKDANSRYLFVWIFDQAFNFVVMEACGSSLATKNRFGILEKTYAFFSCFRKRSDVLQQKQDQSAIPIEGIYHAVVVPSEVTPYRILCRV